MSQNLRKLRNKKLSGVFDFAPLYRCQIDILEVWHIKEIWEKEKDEPRRRKKVDIKREEETYLYISGNDGGTVCSIVEGDAGDFLVFLPPKDAKRWLKNEPDYVFNSENEALTAIECICRKYNENRTGRYYNEFEKSPKGKEEISVREILKWYEAFRKAGLSISDISNAIKVRQDFDEVGLTIESAKRALEVDRYIKKKYNIQK